MHVNSRPRIYSNIHSVCDKSWCKDTPRTFVSSWNGLTKKRKKCRWTSQMPWNKADITEKCKHLQTIRWRRKTRIKTWKKRQNKRRTWWSAAIGRGSREIQRWVARRLEPRRADVCWGRGPTATSSVPSSDCCSYPSSPVFWSSLPASET